MTDRFGFGHLNGLETWTDPIYKTLFIRSSNGRIYVIAPNEDWAKTNDREFVYETSDGLVIVKASTSEKNRYRKYRNKKREYEERMMRLWLSGRSALDKKKSDTKGRRTRQHPVVDCPFCGRTNGEKKE